MSNRMYIILGLLLLILTSCSRYGKKSQGDPRIENQFIVVFKKNQVQANLHSSSRDISAKAVVTSMATSLAKKHNVKVKKLYHAALQGGLYEMTKDQAKKLAADPSVAYVEPDQIIRLSATQSSPTWGLDRIDQESGLDQSYTYLDSGVSVNAYVIDSGIRISHEDFEGRAQHGYDFVDDDADSSDCNGHGTHVAGTIGGSEYGVAKNAKLYGVRVLNCSGSGSFSGVIDGIEWVTANHIQPAVANMSLGGGTSQSVDDAVKASVQAGVTYVIAAGNSSRDACGSSPARVGEAITVGSTTRSDRRSSFSNYGSCVDVFAPGTDVKSAWSNGDDATRTISGTSMAAPHVAGVVALYLGQNPTASPTEVTEKLLEGSVSDALSDVRTGSPNLLVNTLYIEEFEEEDGGGDDGGDDDEGDGGDDDDSEDDDNEEPTDSVLENGVAVTGLGDNQNGEKFFTIEVPENARNLKFEISGGSGDADLYVRKGSIPELRTYDCRPYRNGNEETCDFESAEAAIYHVMLRAFRPYAGVSLKASYEVILPEPPRHDGPCSNCEKYTGGLDGRNDAEVQPDGTFYFSEAGTHEMWLVGKVGTDFDLDFYQWQNGDWVIVDQSLGLKSNEYIKYIGTRGHYQVRVHSYQGSGDYSLWIKKP